MVECTFMLEPITLGLISRCPCIIVNCPAVSLKFVPFHSYTFEQLLKQQEPQEGSSTTVRGRKHGSKEVTIKLKVITEFYVLLMCLNKLILIACSRTK